MAAKQFFNGLSTNAPGAITATQQAIVCQSTSTWSPSGDYVVRIDGFAPGTSTAIFEYVLVTANAQGTGTITCTRGQDSTQGQAFAANATLTPDVSGKMLTDAFARIDQTTAQAFSGPITVPPSGTIAVPATSYGSLPLKLAETVLAASAANITFSAIPGGFRHLKLSWVGRGDNAAAQLLNLQFNADGGTNYNYGGNDSSTGSANTPFGGAAQTIARIGVVPGTGSATGVFASGTLWILNYASATQRRQFHFQGWRSDATLIAAEYGGGEWANVTTAITSISLTPAAGNLIAGSMATLQGEP